MNEEHSLDLIPEKPLISGFVAPWDTSGWYYVVHGFHAGSRLYANADVTAVRVPDALTGGDHIVTYDSHREGFDDKQGVSFRCEREDDIFIALDEQADPSFLRGFAPVNDHILTSEQRRCALYRRRYHAGDEVVLPGFCGDYPHYTVIICAADAIPCSLRPCCPGSPPTKGSTCARMCAGICTRYSPRMSPAAFRPACTVPARRSARTRTSPAEGSSTSRAAQM